jgi:hypothetical protein
MTDNAYGVQVGSDATGWEVRITDPGGEVAWTRACSSESEARTLASTVKQHLYWLSAEKFREYYKLPA